jgi:hypothetical protein
MRGRRLFAPTGHRVATRGQLQQPPVVRSTRPLRKATPLGRSSDRHRAVLASQNVVLTPAQHCHRDHKLPRLTRPILLRPAQLSRRDRTTEMDHRGFSIATPAWLHTRIGAIGRTLRTASPSVAYIRASIFHPPVHSRPTRYKLREPDAHAPWTATMPTQLHKLLGTHKVGTTALHLLSSSLAPTTYANYDSVMRQFAVFCHEEDIHPLQAPT